MRIPCSFPVRALLRFIMWTLFSSASCTFTGTYFQEVSTQNRFSLYIPLLAGNSDQRRVRFGLRPPPSSRYSVLSDYQETPITHASRVILLMVRLYLPNGVDGIFLAE